MRTWRQGIIGAINLPRSACLYVHCLKYPLVKVYDEYESEHEKLAGYLFSVLVDKSVLRRIDRLGELKLSKEEKDEGDSFLFDSKENKIYLRKLIDGEDALMEKLYATEEIVEKYYAVKGE